MFLILILGIGGEIAAFAVITPLYGLKIGLFAAVGSGVATALAASMLLYWKHRSDSEHLSVAQGPARGSFIGEPISNTDDRVQDTTNVGSEGRLAAARWMLVGTLGCATGALAFSSFLFKGYDSSAFSLGLFSTITISVLIGAPLLFVLGQTRHELARLRMSRSSSVDDLTDCLDRGVLSAVIDSFRTHSGGKGQGSFFLVDVDGFKALVERSGQAWSDEALRLVSNSIKATVRNGDLVGRLGGGQFGVFLPGATRNNTARVAERIRRKIAETVFEPNGRRFVLTVSVGAVVFEDQLEFEDLFRKADEMLVTAKEAGHNRMELRAL